MRLKRLQLHDFRSFSTLDLTLSGQVNVFVGGNAEGKTNALEAVYLLATGRSHRAVRDRELVRWGAPAYLARGDFERPAGPLRVEVGFSGEGRKVLRLNGLPKRRLSEIIGQARVVLFAPEDLELVKGAPEVRRHYIDLQLSQVSPAYYHHLATYHRILEQRNRLLKGGSQAEAMGLAVWDEKLVAHGVEIIQRRLTALEKLSRWVALAQRQVSGGQEELSVSYQSSIVGDSPRASREATAAGQNDETLGKAFRRRLEKLRPVELERGMTLVGPHRDDLRLEVNGQDARLFSSQGQQRTAVLALKLAEVEFLAADDGDQPILLLDDVLSELDERRRGLLLETVGRVQTIITGTDAAPLAGRLAADVAFYHVARGTITPAEDGRAQ
ncbi:MAG: DNA replication/repair protein RecF [Bacillota bacterium]